MLSEFLDDPFTTGISLVIRFPLPSIGISSDGSKYVSGYVELYHSTSWGAVCANYGGWTDKDANVLCKTAGYTRGKKISTFTQPSTFAPKTSVMLQQPNCRGTETDIIKCPRFSWMKHSYCRARGGVKCTF